MNLGPAAEARSRRVPRRCDRVQPACAAFRSAPARSRTRSTRWWTPDAPVRQSGLRQLLQGAPAAGAARNSRTSDGRWTSSTARTGAEVARWPEPVHCACRRSCSTTDGRSASRARSSGTSAKARDSFRIDSYERAQVTAVDVLRAVRPRALDRRRPLLGRVLREARKPSPTGFPERMAAGNRALGALERHLERQRVPRRRLVLARGHRSVRGTRTWRRKAASTSTRTPQSVRGSTASPRSLVTCRSRRDGSPSPVLGLRRHRRKRTPSARTA